MSTIMFAFLGAVRYQPATYSFGRAEEDRSKARFLPQALLNVFAASGRESRPERIVLCGTETSGWEPLVEALANPEKAPAEDAPKLTAIDQAQADVFAQQYADILGIPVKTELISFAVTSKEQASFVAMVERHVADKDVVHFDITHGFRHLPLVALVAALAVQKLRRATIAGIWYGAWELRETEEGLSITGSPKLTPVIRLDGLLSISDWLSAISVFDATGNVNAFSAPLRREEQAELASRLEDAAFRERVQRTETARSSALIALDALKPVVSGIASIAKPAIEQRLGWARADPTSEAGFDHALRFLAQNNELRAATLIYEATVEKCAASVGASAGNSDFTSALSEACKETRDRKASQKAKAFAINFLRVRDLRNDLVHLRPRTNRFVQAMSRQDVLKMELTVMAEELRRPIPTDLLAEIETQWAKPITEKKRR